MPEITQAARHACGGAELWDDFEWRELDVGNVYHHLALGTEVGRWRVPMKVQ